MSDEIKDRERVCSVYGMPRGIKRVDVRKHPCELRLKTQQYNRREDIHTRYIFYIYRAKWYTQSKRALYCNDAPDSGADVIRTIHLRT